MPLYNFLSWLKKIAKIEYLYVYYTDYCNVTYILLSIIAMYGYYGYYKSHEDIKMEFPTKFTYGDEDVNKFKTIVVDLSQLCLDGVIMDGVIKNDFLAEFEFVYRIRLIIVTINFLYKYIYI